MKITIEIPDHAAEMLKDLAGALQTIAATVTVEKAKKETKQLDAFQKLADENKPKVTIQDVRAIMAELLREAGKEAVQELLQKRGAKKLTEVNPKHYAELKAEAEEILEGLR